MRFQTLAPFLVASGASAFTPASTTSTDLLAANGLINLAINQIELAFTGKQGSCTLANAAIRREWLTLTNAERTAYTDAVLCLQSKPALTNQTLVPGAKTRYDDFVWTHINQTLIIHGTTSFLSWHRYFTWTYEQALRNECGYTGYQPYWNWGKTAFDPVNSPVFDGSAYSMGGNGVYEAHNCTEALPTGLNCIPPGQGGGCVETGPFKDMSVNLGPVDPTLAEVGVVSTGSGAAYNPRCLKRDVSVWVSSQWNTDTNSSDLITQNTNIASFQTTMQGDFATGFYGVHTGGHFTIGGDPGGDIFTSPGDPAFFLHHAQIDRTWWIWQNQDLKNRQNAIAGTITLNNDPPSRNGTLQDYISLGVNAVDIQIADAMNTLAGPFCYIYV
ncbi:Di-copper centre-containing protein [Hyaloscypha variabilis]|uniref:Di-copper centre-containing protein n=1 Tax=Hyaloscypha variabilis (strain UAMH 11265 / GT02V1 / F) TaxID=1149755 RepID=A0A2J6S762_HYAVF|nr:Di-copper centre-containing protein [Hyaloscypha variabilis F]